VGPSRAARPEGPGLGPAVRVGRRITVRRWPSGSGWLPGGLPEGRDARWVGGGDTSASSHGDGAVLGHGQLPPAFGDRGVMPSAQGHEVRDDGGAVVFAGFDVVAVGELDRHPTPREPTPLITCGHRGADPGGDGGGRCGHPDDLAVVFDHELQVRIRRQAAQCLSGDSGPQAGDGGQQPGGHGGDVADEVVELTADQDPRPRPPRGPVRPCPGKKRLGEQDEGVGTLPCPHPVRHVVAEGRVPVRGLRLTGLVVGVAHASVVTSLGPAEGAGMAASRPATTVAKSSPSSSK
jgi:hypothetical protein